MTFQIGWDARGMKVTLFGNRRYGMTCLWATFVLICLSSVTWSAGVGLHWRVDECGATLIHRSKPGSDRLGLSLAAAGDFNGDGLGDVLIGAPGYNPLGPRGEGCGAAFLLWGDKIVEAEIKRIDIADLGETGTILCGALGTGAGHAVAGLGDIDADGFDDIAVATGRSIQTTIIYGHEDAAPVIHLQSPRSRWTTVLNTGYSVARAGDINGDGYGDVILGNPFAELEETDDGGTYVGRVTVMYGGDSIPELINPLQLGDLGFSVRGQGEGMVGEAVSAAGDVDADGYNDFLIAAPTAGTEREGRGFLVRGQPVFQLPIRYAFVAQGAMEHISEAGDVNGDGQDDLLFITRDFRCVLIWGGPDAAKTRLVDLRKPLAETLGVTLEGAGYGVGVGDVNGDGYDDLAFGLPFQSPGGLIGAGQVVIVLGREAWQSNINLLAPEVAHIVIDGVEANRGFGSSIAGLGDIENDGFADILVGAPYGPTQTTNQNSRDSGYAYILYGDELTQEGTAPAP